MLVMIDPGHGGSDPGGHKLEKSANLEASFDLAEILQAYGIAPVLTRYRDGTIPLSSRSRMEHDLKPSCFLSVHHNAFHDPGPRGFEVWTSPGVTVADTLAAAILDQVRLEIPELPQRRESGPTGPDKEGRFHVLTNTRSPAVLLELEFLTNPDARRWVTDPHTRRFLMCAVARAVVTWGANRKESVA